jgi:phosphate transport system substrate-binding protein
LQWINGGSPQTLDGPTLSRIWSGNITKYNDPQLTALNPGLPLPDHDIILAYVYANSSPKF